LTSAAWAAGQEKVLHTFESYAKNPDAGLVMDSSGNLFGTTQMGGGCNLAGCGTVFELSPVSGGGWSFSTLYNFKGGSDGSSPAASLILDTSGNLYGTTQGGGDFDFGTVFELSRTSSGWVERILYSFGANQDDGGCPDAALLFDTKGDLFSTTACGGADAFGTVFEPMSGGGWTESVLYSFQGGDDGDTPMGALVLDTLGNLYGTTEGGNPLGGGVVFELTPSSGGAWTESVLYSFQGGLDGYGPSGALAMDPAGSLYGTTEMGGFRNFGSVFKLTPGVGGIWTESVIHHFHPMQGDGYAPHAGVIIDALGNLYGTTVFGGAMGTGTLFKLTPGQSGQWTEKLYSFNGSTGGSAPYGGVIQDKAGNFYGTTFWGGNGSGQSGNGVVFALVP